MKVLFDYQCFHQYVGGISKSFCCLADSFPKGWEYEFSICVSNNYYLHSMGLVSDLKPIGHSEKNFIISKHFPGQGTLFRCAESFCKKFPSFKNINQEYSVKKLVAGDFSVFHPTFFDTYFLDYLNGKPFVTTIHDMIPELFNWKGDESRRKRIHADRSDKIIAVSENTKKDIIETWHIPEDKIEVIYHGCPKRVDTSALSPICDRPYFLYVGSRYGYKNFNGVIKSFSLFLPRHKEMKLICVGSPFDKKETALISSLHLTDSVESMDCDDLELANLYSKATAFIFPSDYEGFGIPILEAMTYDCPLILNNSSCFPEIAGDAALYFEEAKPGRSLIDRMEDIVSMTLEERKNLILKEQLRRRRFSWEKSSERLCSVYENILSEKQRL